LNLELLQRADRTKEHISAANTTRGVSSNIDRSGTTALLFLPWAKFLISVLLLRTCALIQIKKSYFAFVSGKAAFFVCFINEMCHNSGY
jgi:hypothetical protein